jgi:hypothetical protein
MTKRKPRKPWDEELLMFLDVQESSTAWEYEPPVLKMPRTAAEVCAELNQTLQDLHVEGVEIGHE